MLKRNGQIMWNDTISVLETRQCMTEIPQKGDNKWGEASCHSGFLQGCSFWIMDQGADSKAKAVTFLSWDDRIQNLEALKELEVSEQSFGEEETTQERKKKKASLWVCLGSSLILC